MSTDAEVRSDPVVGTLPGDMGASLIGLLNSWRDGMPVIEGSALDDAGVQPVAVSVGGKVVGGYLLKAVPLSCEMIGLAINPAFRRSGLGRMCCMDALFRAGKRPLVLTADDASVPFAKAVGFKLIGKRKQPDGSMLTRMGWHAPRPGSDPDQPGAC